tara:strand:+ start:21178 stop:21549 length:372 start_codon:yes stop_codon:yes gene_type:complete
MKNLILLAFLFITISANAQLSEKSEWLRANKEEIYQDIRNEAVREWDGNNRMIIHFIDTQSEAFCKFFKEPYKSYAQAKDGTKENTVMLDLISRWHEVRGEGVYVNYNMIIYGINKHLINSNY